LQRVEDEVAKRLGAKAKKIEKGVDRDKDKMLASFFEAQKRTSATIATLEAWGKGAAVRGVGRVRKTGELYVTALGTYEKISEALEALDRDDLKTFMHDYVNAISGRFEANVNELEGDEKARQKLVQRLTALLDVETERAAGAWLQIVLKLASINDKNIEEVTSIFSSETFAHAESRFVTEFKKEGVTKMNSAAEKVFNRLAESHNGEGWVEIKGKKILSKKEVTTLVDGIAKAAIEEIRKLYPLLEGDD
jgi:hypothetical protein